MPSLVIAILYGIVQDVHVDFADSTAFKSVMSLHTNSYVDSN